MLLEEMEIISRKELIVLQHIFSGGRSAWFPLLTAHQRRFDEFDTSVICQAVLILWLGLFLLQDMF